MHWAETVAICCFHGIHTPTSSLCLYKGSANSRHSCCDYTHTLIHTLVCGEHKCYTEGLWELNKNHPSEGDVSPEQLPVRMVLRVSLWWDPAARAEETGATSFRSGWEHPTGSFRSGPVSMTRSPPFFAPPSINPYLTQLTDARLLLWLEKERSLNSRSQAPHTSVHSFMSGTRLATQKGRVWIEIKPVSFKQISIAG